MILKQFATTYLLVRIYFFKQFDIYYFRLDNNAVHILIEYNWFY